METIICTTCGVEQINPQRETCPICLEERQYVNPTGQTWTTLAAMQTSGTYQNVISDDGAGVYAIQTTPAFGIGQTAYLIQGKSFNLLWDCITYLDSATKEQLDELGGLQAIALSHPHYYATQVEWAETFDVPIYIHEDDASFVTRPSERIVFWSGEHLELTEDLMLHRVGGHFKGAVICERKDASAGLLLTGDIIRIVADRAWVSFMYSYPNVIPLPAKTVARMAETLRPLQFEKLYDAFHRKIETGASEAVARSAERYIAALNGDWFTT